MERVLSHAVSQVGRVELVYDGALPAGPQLWHQMPAYSYVMYRTLDRVPESAGYFHASWRQEAVILGKQDYVALEAKGQGKFVGWNVTVRSPGNDSYPVDENEKFFVDGEQEPSVEFQGLEDSFGFSWGFPESRSSLPWTAFYPFFKGACGCRFFTGDAIPFQKSLRVAIGFGKHEASHYFKEFSQPESRVQFSSTVYWYQTEPHAPFPPMPAAAERARRRKTACGRERKLFLRREKCPFAKNLKEGGNALVSKSECVAKK